MTEVTYGGLTEGVGIFATIYGVVVELGDNYAIIETDGGEEIQINNDWDFEEAD